MHALPEKHKTRSCLPYNCRLHTFLIAAQCRFNFCSTNPVAAHIDDILRTFALTRESFSRSELTYIVAEEQYA